MSNFYVACDLGAESGRVTVGSLNQGKLALSELHRFPNIPIREKDSLYWDIPQLYQELLEGLRKVAVREDPIHSVSCDSWGVDYLLFEPDGSLITPTFHYRDPRSRVGSKEVLSKVNWELIYAETGIQNLSIPSRKRGPTGCSTGSNCRQRYSRRSSPRGAGLDSCVRRSLNRPAWKMSRWWLRVPMTPRRRS